MKVEATVEEAKLRHALRAVMTEMEELDSEKTAETQRARHQVWGPRFKGLGFMV